MKLKYFFALFGLALISTGCQAQPNTPANVNDTAGKNYVMYKKDSGWGPCQESYEPCSEIRTLWISGLLTISGQRTAEFNLTPEQVSQVSAAIESSGILQKECLASPVMDYSATYYLSIGSQKKEIQFPGCENDLSLIDAMINGFIDDESLPPTQGGA